MATKAYQGPVELNGITYQVRGQVYRSAISEWPEPAPVTSERLRTSRRLLSSWGVETVKGLLVDRDYAGALAMAYDSTIETRFQHQLTLPGLWVAETAWDYDDVTANTNDLSIVGGVEFDSEVWVLHAQTVATVRKLYVRRFNESTNIWDTTEELLTGAGTDYNPHALVKHGAYMFAVASSATTRFLLRRPQGSSTWTNMMTTPTALTGCVIDDATALTDETTDINSAGANDVSPFPTFAANDAVYFGLPYASNRLRINVGTARVGGVNAQWEYYAGLAGTTEIWPMVESLSDGTAIFSNTGTNDVTFRIPSLRTGEWVSRTINNIGAYWIRCRGVSGTITTPPLLTQAWAVGFPDVQAASDRTLLLSLGNVLYLAEWVASTGKISIYYSEDSGQSFAKAADTITSAYPPTSFVVYDGYDIDGNLGALPHLGTAEGVWSYDLDGEHPNLVYPMATHAWNCRGMAVWMGGLYIPSGLDPLGQLIEYKLQGGTITLAHIGLDNGSGLPAARIGHIIDLRPAGPWLLALLRNNTTYECGVFAFDGLGWHHMYDSNTSSGGWATTGTPEPQLIALSTVDTTQRLHILWRISATSADAAHMKNPLANPLSISGFVYEDDGYLDLSRYAASLPEYNANWLRGHVDADSLSADTTGEYIAWQYGADGEARTANTIGNFLSGTKARGVAATNAGVSSKTFASRLHFYRSATTTNSPKLYSWVVEFLKIPTVRHVWRFLVDKEASASQGMLTPEDVITNLETVENLVTQVTFSIANESQVYVKALPPAPNWAFGMDTEPDPFELTPRKGTVEVIVVELIA